MNPIGLILIAATVLVPAYQLFSLPGITDQAALFSQYLGLAALILMAWSQMLSTRLPGIEHLFGGLDRVYILHKWTGIVAMGAVLMHDTIGAEMRGLGRETALNDFAESLGEISLYGLLLLVLISVATFIPYHLWKWSHKAMGALFAVGALHFFLITKPFAMTDPAGLYTGSFCVAGIVAYLWMLLPHRLRPSYRYKIAKLETTGGALAITLAPKGKGIRPLPGQFGVLRFTGAGINEPHPFSFSKIDYDGTVCVTVKALGDFTSTLDKVLRIGQRVRVAGPFGKFRYAGKGPEVWIAGGIGITPFLVWAENLKAESEPVDLFYCIKSRTVAPHLSEIEKLAACRPNLTLHIVASGEGQRISAEMISNAVGPGLSRAKVSFCGPRSLQEALKKGLKHYGVENRQFQNEEFEFRSGIGIKRLIKWLGGRYLRFRNRNRRARPSPSPENMT
ncbi:ferredoxin reductase family protein [Ruegeria arenilitoris]|uniref:ferredoxin reductase family protein n=1 Tax=Ruegeria arenilitoris TaxID=1173585 RepID=UPI0014811F15|nr:ferric reductase-like transmembrane domain-containing protein [Ruegeria arenilitoris]